MSRLPESGRSGVSRFVGRVPDRLDQAHSRRGRTVWFDRRVIHRNFANGCVPPLHLEPATRYHCSRSNGLRAGRSGRRQEQGFASKHLASLFLCLDAKAAAAAVPGPHIGPSRQSLESAARRRKDPVTSATLIAVLFSFGIPVAPANVMGRTSVKPGR